MGSEEKNTEKILHPLELEILQIKLIKERYELLKSKDFLTRDEARAYFCDLSDGAFQKIVDFLKEIKKGAYNGRYKRSDLIFAHDELKCQSRKQLQNFTTSSETQGSRLKLTGALRRRKRSTSQILDTKEKDIKSTQGIYPTFLSR